MQPTGISPNLVRFLTTAAPDLMTELFTPGKVLEADVVSVFRDRAVLSFGRGVRLEVALQAPLQEGQRVRVQVQPQEAAPTAGQPRGPLPGQTPAAAQQGPAPQPGAVPQPAPQTYLPSGVLLPQQGQAGPQQGAQPGTQPVPQPAAQQGAPHGAPQAAPHAAQPSAQPSAQQAAQQPLQPQDPALPPQAQPQRNQQAAPGQRSQAPLPPARSQAEPGAETRQPAPIVLKVIGQVPPREAGRTAAVSPPGAEAQGAPAAKGMAAAAPALRDMAAAALPGQPAPVAGQPVPQQPGLPQIVWLPIPLPGGGQGWAQIQVQEDDSPKARAIKGGPVQQVRIWWETPALGPVQVTMESAASSLAALFTAASPESKGAVEQSLHQLQRRFAEVGFPEARVGCRAAAPGEAIEPARTEGASRLDKRM